MFRTIKDTICSLWPSSRNNTDRVSLGSKRKRSRDECDNDTDLQSSRVEKKRRIDSSASNTIVKTIKMSASRMAEWVRPKSQRFDQEFQTKDAGSRHGSNNSANLSRGPHMNGDERETANHSFEVRHNMSHMNHLKGVAGNGDIQTHKPSNRSTIFQSKQSTASLCIRLKEKEEYQKLLQLQAQRSPWQRPLSYGIPGAPSLPATTEADAITISSNSSTYEPSTGAPSASKKDPKSFINHSSSSSTPATIPRPTIRSGSLSDLLSKQRSQSGIGTYQRAPVVGNGSQKSVDHRRGPSHTQSSMAKENQSTSPIVIDDDEDGCQSQSKAASSSSKALRTQASRENSISTSFLRSRFMNDHDMEEQRRKRNDEQERRKRQIAEEEQKAKAYAEKRRAQEISLERKLNYQMRIFDEEPEVSEEIFLEEEEEEEEKLPELTHEMLAMVKEAMRPGNPSEVLSEGFRLQITRRDMATLSGLNWLNDEIINFYMNMLVERGEKEGRSKVYAFNTFFYPKIMSGGHSAVKRWTKKVDIFAMHYIIIPVHLGMHWCLCVADMKDKIITYYDSMGASNNACLNAVLEYINQESIVKKNTPINKQQWKTRNAKDNPHQMNGGDCGMFMCKYAEYITRNKEITFTQQDMPYFRKRMIYEILTKTLLQ